MRPASLGGIPSIASISLLALAVQLMSPMEIVIQSKATHTHEQGEQTAAATATALVGGPAGGARLCVPEPGLVQFHLAWCDVGDQI